MRVFVGKGGRRERLANALRRTGPRGVPAKDRRTGARRNFAAQLRPGGAQRRSATDWTGSRRHGANGPNDFPRYSAMSRQSYRNDLSGSMDNRATGRLIRHSARDWTEPEIPSGSRPGVAWMGGSMGRRFAKEGFYFACFLLRYNL